jgi:two-component system, cell cycle sensor histidine kinase and response regulator CckA
VACHPLFTTRRESGGTGLGLATVYGTIKRCGGVVRVASEAGRGATFSLYLPLVTAQVPAATARRVGSRVGLEGTETVLMVEDDERVRRAGHRVLELFGYQVLEAATGMDALRLAENHESPIDIAITDLVMPQMSGEELTARLRGIRPDLPIVFVSGYGDDGPRSRDALPDGATLLTKPYAASTLVGAIREALSKGEQVLR